MTAAEAKAYLLEHRDDPEALQAFLEKSRALNPNPRTYGPDDNISDAIDEYLKEQERKKASS
ncbi:MAG: hypothetical protein WBB01_23635 [Phormidesmis sp.]